MAILASIASEAKGDAERAVAISDLPEYLYKTERENKVFFTCSLIDYIARHEEPPVGCRGSARSAAPGAHRGAGRCVP